MRRFGRREQLNKVGVDNPCANLVAPEIIGVAVSFAIDKQVGEIVIPEPEATLLPQIFKVRGARFLVNFERRYV